MVTEMIRIHKCIQCFRKNDSCSSYEDKIMMAIKNYYKSGQKKQLLELKFFLINVEEKEFLIIDKYYFFITFCQVKVHFLSRYGKYWLCYTVVGHPVETEEVHKIGISQN